MGIYVRTPVAIDTRICYPVNSDVVVCCLTRDFDRRVVSEGFTEMQRGFHFVGRLRTWAIAMLCLASSAAQAFTFSDGSSAVCRSFTGQVVLEVVLPPGVQNPSDYTGATDVGVDGRARTTWNYAKLMALPPSVHDFIFFHECAHARVPTTDEVVANCEGLKAMRRAGKSSSIIEEELGEFHTNLGYMGPRYGVGADYWRRTIQCAGPSEIVEGSSDGQSDPARDRSGNWSSSGLPRPGHPGRRVGGVVSDELAEKGIDDDYEVDFDRNPRHPYAAYMISIRNNGSRPVDCLVRAIINLKSHATKKTVRWEWNVDEQKFFLKPGETRVIKGSIEWYGNSAVFPSFDYETLAMFAR